MLSNVNYNTKIDDIMKEVVCETGDLAVIEKKNHRKLKLLYNKNEIKNFHHDLCCTRVSKQ